MDQEVRWAVAWLVTREAERELRVESLTDADEKRLATLKAMRRLAYGAPALVKEIVDDAVAADTARINASISHCESHVAALLEKRARCANDAQRADVDRDIEHTRRGIAGEKDRLARRWR